MMLDSLLEEGKRDICNTPEITHNCKGTLKGNHCLKCFTYPGDSEDESACNARDMDLTPGSRRSPGRGNSNPLQHSCLENFMGREDWQATVHGVTKKLDVT